MPAPPAIRAKAEIFKSTRLRRFFAAGQNGADGGGRTHTSLRIPDFESSASANSATSATRLRTSVPQYRKVLDERKHPIRRPWKRNGNLVARITVEDDAGCKAVKWVPLTANTVGTERER